MRYYNSCVKLGTWKGRRLNQNRSKVVPQFEIPGRAEREERLSRSKLKQAFLTDSDAELFIFLINVLGSADEKFGV